MAIGKTMTTQDFLGAKIPERDPMQLLKALQAGLPSTTLNRFKRAAGLADQDVAELLHIGGRTLTRVRASKRRLPADLSDRLYAVASAYAQAERVFGDRKSAIGWLNEPQFALADRPPRELLSTELGRRQVIALLNRIEHGFLA
jgi:putative toxin-antitoxin system antitoxin component (TIGR02293 family)